MSFDFLETVSLTLRSYRSRRHTRYSKTRSHVPSTILAGLRSSPSLRAPLRERKSHHKRRRRQRQQRRLDKKRSGDRSEKTRKPLPKKLKLKCFSNESKKGNSCDSSSSLSSKYDRVNSKITMSLQHNGGNDREEAGSRRFDG